MNVFFLLMMSNVEAKDLDTRVGVGVNNWFASQPSVSIRYALPLPVEQQETQVEAVLGFSTDPSSPSALTIGGRALYAVVVEDNLNVFAGGGAGFLMLNGTGALRLQPAMEFQYFFMGLDNLSFTAGVGMNIDVGKGNNKVELSSSMLGGLHYWF